MSEHWPQKNCTPLRWEIKHGGKREDLLEFAAALVKDSVRTLSSVWKRYPNDTAVGRQTYAAVWIQPNFFPRLRLSWNISTHAFIGGVELWLLTGAQDVFERDASAKIWFMKWIYLPLFFIIFIYLSLLFHTDSVQATDIFNPPLGLTPDASGAHSVFFSILPARWSILASSDDVRFSSVCVWNATFCHSVWLSQKEMKNLLCLPLLLYGGGFQRLLSIPAPSTQPPQLQITSLMIQISWWSLAN